MSQEEGGVLFWRYDDLKSENETQKYLSTECMCDVRLHGSQRPHAMRIPLLSLPGAAGDDAGLCSGTHGNEGGGGSP